MTSVDVDADEMLEMKNEMLKLPHLILAVLLESQIYETIAIFVRV